MSAMVTGGTGFVGLSIVEALLARGADVVVAGLDDVPAPASAAAYADYAAWLRASGAAGASRT